MWENAHLRMNLMQENKKLWKSNTAIVSLKESQTKDNNSCQENDYMKGIL